jgi:biotin-dependent carboxylase-like uncharacterized protein
VSAALVVRKAGICSTLQDFGRSGYSAYGVPRSGALDTVALGIVNALAGNAAHTAAIEMMYSGVSVEAANGTARIAASVDATIVSADRAERPLPAWRSALVHAGETVRIGPIRNTAAAYLAVEGGFGIEPVLGSVSTYLRGALGGWRGRALKAGDVLPLVRSEPNITPERECAEAPALAAPDALRVIPGPHADRFEAASLATFLSSQYIVSSASDRAGQRLEGSLLRHVGGYDTSSEGVAGGSIQVPGSGLPVILIADHPTVGGYPKIATIISADLPAAGRLRIGSSLRFVEVDQDGAAAARIEAQRALDAVLGRIK